MKLHIFLLPFVALAILSLLLVSPSQVAHQHLLYVGSNSHPVQGWTRRTGSFFTGVLWGVISYSCSPGEWGAERESAPTVTLVLCNFFLKAISSSSHKEKQQILKEECEGHYKRGKAKERTVQTSFSGKGDVICTVGNASS